MIHFPFHFICRPSRILCCRCISESWFCLVSFYRFFLVWCFQFYLITVSHYHFWIFMLLLDFIFNFFDLSEIHDMLTTYRHIRMCSGFRYIVRKCYYGKSSRGDPPDIFKNYNSNTYSPWPLTLSFECRDVRKRKKSTVILLTILCTYMFL